MLVSSGRWKRDTHGKKRNKRIICMKCFTECYNILNVCIGESSHGHRRPDTLDRRHTSYKMQFCIALISKNSHRIYLKHHKVRRATDQNYHQHISACTCERFSWARIHHKTHAALLATCWAHPLRFCLVVASLISFQDISKKTRSSSHQCGVCRVHTLKRGNRMSMCVHACACVYQHDYVGIN